MLKFSIGFHVHYMEPGLEKGHLHISLSVSQEYKATQEMSQRYTSKHRSRMIKWPSPSRKSSYPKSGVFDQRRSFMKTGRFTALVYPS